MVLIFFIYFTRNLLFTYDGYEVFATDKICLFKAEFGYFSC